MSESVEKTSDLEFYELLVKLRDFHNGIAEALDSFIQTKSKAVLKEYNVDKIKWVEAEGQHGKYERSDDANNPEFKALLKDLAEHNGKLTHKGYFYWVFQNGVTIGRKKKQ